MKLRKTLILLCLMTLFPSFCNAQYGFDAASVEAYINDHKEQRSLLIAVKPTSTIRTSIGN